MVLETWNEVSSFLGAARPSESQLSITDVVYNRYLVQKRLPVDLAVLCTIVERLFGLAIMTTRHKGLGSLHGVLLPRTWILALWEDFVRYQDRRLYSLKHLAHATENLLRDIYTGNYQRDSIREPRERSEFCLKHY